MLLTLIWHQLRGHVLAFDSDGGKPTAWRCWTCHREWNR
jgi:hypothetical protein